MNVFFAFRSLAKTETPSAAMNYDKQFFIENKGQWDPEVLYLSKFKSDILGRKSLHLDLSSQMNKITFSTKMLEHGVYIYKYSIDGRLVTTGKLIKD